MLRSPHRLKVERQGRRPRDARWAPIADCQVLSQRSSGLGGRLLRDDVRALADEEFFVRQGALEKVLITQRATWTPSP